MAIMLDWLSMTYLWLKAGHIIFMVFWMAGLFVLPRQMLYMHDTAVGSPEEAQWVERLGLLRTIILTPSLIAVWVLGLALAFTIGAWDQGWFHAKLFFVLLMTGYHGFMVGNAKRMASGTRKLTPKQLKMWGEAPAVLLAIIVVLVIVKPF